MKKQIKITTNHETLHLVRKAVATYLNVLESYNETDNTDYQELEKLYNKLVDLTFGIGE